MLNSFRWTVAASIATGIFFWAHFAVGSEAQEELRGKAFTDPYYIQQMPPGWEERPVLHDPSVGEADLVITLNQQFFSFLEPLIDGYASERGLRVVMIRGTCGIAARALANKAEDVGGFCCPPGETDRLPGLKFHTLGIHPLSIIVNPENPVGDITEGQVRRIFSGEISRWSELGWKDIPIQPVARFHCKKRPGHWKLILGDEDLFSPRLQEVAAIEDMLSIVASMRGAIGYEVMWLAEKQAGKVKALKINGNSPEDLDSLLSGKYPFYRVLYLSTWEGPGVENPNAVGLIEYLEEKIERNGREIGIVPAAELKRAGWNFRGDELIDEPH